MITKWFEEFFGTLLGDMILLYLCVGIVIVAIFIGSKIAARLD